MKPLRLEMQAFGPYAHRSSVDFRALSAGGLFLIHGPTGAGKTSILDGICFALFGRASGAERAPDGLRSDRAAGDLPTEVRLEFALGADVYRVTRQPKQELAKKRGEGLRQSRPEGMLEKYSGMGDAAESGSWDLIASGDKKTDDAIIGLLGMNEDQFRQVVVLPQGQFRKFLAAGSDEREVLLERLFRTHRFRELSQGMSVTAQALAKEIEDKRARATAHLQAFNTERDDALVELLVQAEARLSTLSAGEADLEARHREASKSVAAARAAKKQSTDLDAFESRLQELTRERDAIESARRRLTDERRARPVIDTHRRVQELEREAAKLTAESLSAETSLRKADADAAAATQVREDIAAHRPEFEAWQVEHRELIELLPTTRRWMAEKSETTRRSENLATLEKALRIQEQEILSRKKVRVELEAKSDELQMTIAKAAEQSAAREKLEGAVAEHKRTTATLEKVRALEKTRESLARALALNAKARDAAQKESTRLKLAYHLSQAARLAQSLGPGEACPVCGSHEHPQPATTHAEAPSDEIIERAETRLGEVEGEFQRLNAEHALREEERHELAAGLTSLLGPESAMWDERLREREQTIRAELAPVNAALKESKEARVELEALRLRRQQLEREFAAAEEGVQRARTAFESAREESAAARARVEELEARLPANRRDPDELEARGREIAPRIDAFRARELESQTKFEAATRAGAAARERLSLLAEQRQSKEDELVRTLHLRAERLQSTGFIDVDAALASAMTDAEIASVESHVRNFENEWTHAERRATELRAELALVSSEFRDLARLESEFELIDRARSESKAEAMALQSRVLTLKSAIERAESASRDIAALETRYRVVGRLAAIAAGQPPNLSRVNFQRYVLASRLDEVLEQASRRLSLMSSGRFRLARSRKPDDKRKNAGLELEVEDAFTGTARPTASLSGGEGFLASLALALGVADVVQMHLGGVRLEAVFVDEGFGTLDPEALELAMRTLAELQAGGRMVGIISHVPELRDQIARRLAVRKTHDGSEIVWESTV